MQYVHTNEANDNRLRFVFDDKVVSLHLGADATMGDIASALREFAPLEYGTPIAIDVTVAGVQVAPPRPIRSARHAVIH